MALRATLTCSTMLSTLKTATRCGLLQASAYTFGKSHIKSHIIKNIMGTLH
ncbi:hypothetical protein HMPREF1575_00717 [Gardnerella vaginalis JCP7672]|nr:hypothetical protein HMPREF1575_00717 [Gardnerella vaginalis JCP7672]